MPPPIVFLSDYGLQDEFVGICHAVVARLAPDVRVIDLTHAIPPQDVLRGAVVLSQSLDYLPRDAVVLAIVDPGVGTARRAIAVRAAGGQFLIGPDNGLLSLAWQELGGAEEAVEITSADVLLHPVSATFHGRDVFAPAAAMIAIDGDLAALGAAIDVTSLETLTLSEPGVASGTIRCEVLSLDRFGNVQLNARREHLERAGLDAALSVEVQSATTTVGASLATTFADIDEGAYGLFLDSNGWLAIACNGASAASALGFLPGDAVTLREPGESVPAVPRVPVAELG